MRKMLAMGLAAVAAVAAAGEVKAFEKPVSYIIPFGPGGESDITARHQQPFFKKLTGQDLVISYKPGGGGAVGWSQLNAMKGDGYTIMGINLPHIIIKPLQKDVGFRTGDITGVYMFHYTPDAIVVKQDSPCQNPPGPDRFCQRKPETPDPVRLRQGIRQPLGPDYL